jgi:hypothetical protein
MDDARYRELVRDNSQLEARIKELEAKGTQRDSNWVPPELKPDLMYNQKYVDAVFNPQPDPAVPASGPPVATSSPGIPDSLRPVPPGLTGVRSSGSFFYRGLVFLVKALAIVGFLAFLIWLVFFKRWGGTKGEAFRRGSG